MSNIIIKSKIATFIEYYVQEYDKFGAFYLHVITSKFIVNFYKNYQHLKL